MPLESPTYISDLVPSNPAHTDGLNQADSHIKIIKQTLQTTFPAITGTVTASHADLNTTTGMAATLAALGSSAVLKTGAQSMAGPLSITGPVNASSIQQGGNALIPAGCIIGWAGSVATVPAGWHLCDGTSGTPNLVGMFIVGAGSSPAPGQTGGSNIQTVASSAVSNHTHTGATAAAGGHSHTGTTDTQGAHSHTGSTGSYALTINDMPSHSHGLGGQTIVVTGSSNGGGGGSFLDNVVAQAQGGGAAHSHGMSADGAHAHNVTTAAITDHAHALTSDGAHSHTVSIDVRPTYYALCLIMKL